MRMMKQKQTHTMQFFKDGELIAQSNFRMQNDIQVSALRKRGAFLLDIPQSSLTIVEVEIAAKEAKPLTIDKAA